MDIICTIMTGYDNKKTLHVSSKKFKAKLVGTYLIL